MQGARDPFFKKPVIEVTEFEKDATLTWDFSSHGIGIWNDSRQTIQWSFTGNKDQIDGELRPKEWLIMDKMSKSKIWFKTSTETPNGSPIRFLAWRGDNS